MDWSGMLTGASGAALFAGIFSLVQWALNRRAAKTDRKADKEEKAAEKRAETEKCGAEKLDALYIVVRDIWYFRVKQTGREHLSRGWISTEDLEDFLNMHKIYHDDLQGNGFLNEILRQVKGLPISDKKNAG